MRLFSDIKGAPPGAVPSPRTLSSVVPLETVSEDLGDLGGEDADRASPTRHTGAGAVAQHMAESKKAAGVGGERPSQANATPFPLANHRRMSTQNINLMSRMSVSSTLDEGDAGGEEAFTKPKPVGV